MSQAKSVSQIKQANGNIGFDQIDDKFGYMTLF